MEDIYKDVLKHISVEFKNEEVQDISNGLDILIKRFVAQMTACFPNFKVERITRCGSMAEQTRIKNKSGLEYDYILQMKTWPNCGELHFRRSCEGSMQPLYMVSENHQVCIKTNVLKIFRENLRKSIEKRCKELFCPGSNSHDYNYASIPGREYNIAEGCKNCYIYMKTGRLIYIFEEVIYKWKFVWLSYFPRNFETIDKPFHIKHYDFKDLREISVDIHPVLIVSPERILDNNSQIDIHSTIPGVNYFLFPCFAGNPGHYSSYCNGGSACWRISHYDTEINMLQSTSQVHRDMFMILKFVCKVMFKKKVQKNVYINSYEVKTVVLHHIKNCKLSEPDIGQCLLHTLRLLAMYFKEENLPNAISAFKIFNSAYRDRDSLCFSIIGHIVYALAELLEKGKHSDTTGFLKDLSLLQNKMICSLWRTQTFKPTSNYSRRDVHVEAHQVQSCEEALDSYVEQRKTRTTNSLLNELALTQFRAERLERLCSYYWTDLWIINSDDTAAYNEWLNCSAISNYEDLYQEIELIRQAKQLLPIGCII